MADNTQYYITEKEVSQLMAMSGLPQNFQRLFARDYVAIKRDFNGNVETINNLVVRMEQVEWQIVLISGRLEDAEDGIVDLSMRLDAAELSITSLQESVGIIQLDLAGLHLDFDNHVAATEAHGSSGNIVGTDNYCTPTTGGTVLQAGAVANNASSTVSVTSTPTAAGAAYSQATADTWVNMLNELKADVNQLVADHNTLVGTVNQSLVTERSANQRAT